MKTNLLPTHENFENSPSPTTYLYSHGQGEAFGHCNYLCDADIDLFPPTMRILTPDAVQEPKPQDVVNLVVSSYAKLAKSNSVLRGLEVSREDREHMLEIILSSRLAYQQLCQIASQSIIANPRTWTVLGRQPSVVSRQGSATPQGQIMESSEGPQSEAPKRASQYIHDMMRPNVHMGIHYPAIAEEYGLPLNVNRRSTQVCASRDATPLPWIVPTCSTANKYSTFTFTDISRSESTR